MMRTWCLAWLLACCAASPAAGKPWAERMFETTTHDFGSVARNAHADFRFVLKNPYVEDIHLAGARPSCGCISTKIENPLLKTYETGAVVATLNTRNFLGPRHVTITVTIDRPYSARVLLHVEATIRGDVTLEPGVVALGTVEQGTAVERTATVSHRGRGVWRVLEAKSANSHLSADVVDTRRSWDGVSCRLRVRLDGDAPVGPIRSHLLLITSDSRSAPIPLLVEGRVVSGVTVSPAKLFLGVVAPGDKVTRKLVVRGKRPFRVTAIVSDGGHFEPAKHPGASDAMPPGDARPLHVIPVTFVAGDQPGKVVETIRIQTDLGEAPPVLATFAVAAP